MTVAGHPWASSPPGKHVQLVVVPTAVVHALGRGDVQLASRLSVSVLTPYLLGSECRGLWRMRSEQIANHAADHVWITRIILDTETTNAVGLAGFHGAPDASGMVEIGYRIDPAHRRRGYARAALEVLLATARNDSGVRVIRATVSPGNTASRALIDQYGFREVGQQWDDEDGLEIILEADASSGG